jgi:hypothetical protein
MRMWPRPVARMGASVCRACVGPKHVRLKHGGVVPDQLITLTSSLHSQQR